MKYFQKKKLAKTYPEPKGNLLTKMCFPNKKKNVEHQVLNIKKNNNSLALKNI